MLLYSLLQKFVIFQQMRLQTFIIFHYVYYICAVVWSIFFALINSVQQCAYTLCCNAASCELSGLTLTLCLQSASIQKAINAQECATKEKHARGILFGERVICSRAQRYACTHRTLKYQCPHRYNYVALAATYIRLLHGKIGFLGGFSALAP